MSPRPDERTARVEELRRTRPRSRVLRASVVALLGFVGYAWASGEIAVGDLLSARRGENLLRFLREDALPEPLRRDVFDLGGALAWAGRLFVDRGAEAVLATLWISILAIVLALLGALVLAPFGARTLMSRDPYAVCADQRECERGPGWRLVSFAIRLVLILLRAVPEYLLAFLLLAMLGPTAWPAVLALALHNAGILGRLGADTIENLEPDPLRALRMLGARRRQLLGVGVAPLGLPRFLLYFFYRFETCVREATVLGMLGVISLGHWILGARARQHYDEMLFFVILGGVIVVGADLLSQAVRGWIRDES